MSAFNQLLLLVVFLMLRDTEACDGGIHLMEHLFNEPRYDYRVPPLNPLTSGPIKIKLGLSVYQFYDLIEKEQILVTYGLLYQSWHDPKLSWDPRNFSGHDSLIVDPKRVWVPDIVSYNSEVKGYRLERGILNYTGDITFSYPIILRTFCKFDVSSYPFDKHICKIVYGSWVMTGDALLVEPMNTSVDLSSYVSSVAWELERATVQQNVVYYSGSHKPFYDVTFTFTFKRRVLYDSLYLIFPGAISAIFATTIFVLPVDCSERITTGMAVLVLLSFFFLVVMERLPATSSVLLVSSYYNTTLCQLTVALFLNVVVLRFHYMTEEDVPEWVQKYLLNYGASFLRMKFEGDNDKGEDEHQDKDEDKDEWCIPKDNPVKAVRGMVNVEEFVADKVLYVRLQDKARKSARDIEWKKAAQVLNNICLICHLLFVLATFGATFMRGYSMT